MSELIHEFSGPVTHPESGRAYTARIRGDHDGNGHWQGWVEFVGGDETPPLRTGRETTQSKREHLEYWATGLSHTYLEQALHRAGELASVGAAPPPLPETSFDPGRIREPEPGSNVVRITIETVDPTLPRRLMAMEQLPDGVVRRVEGGGIIVYDGMDAPEGGPSRYNFMVQYGSENAGAVVLGNRLWSALRDEGATLYVRDRKVPIRSHEIIEALRAA